MKKALICLIFLLCFCVSSSTVSAQSPSICNNRCDVNEDCGKGYRCYVGVCRILACPASSTCVCNSNVTTQATPTVRPTATPFIVVKEIASPSAVPVRTSTVSAGLKNSPKTGFSSPVLFTLALSLFIGGMLVSNSFVFQNFSPEQINRSRLQKKQGLNK